MAIKQELSEPDPARLAWRDLIKKTIREVVTQPELDALIVIQQTVDTWFLNLSGGMCRRIEELRRLHEGVLAR
ncbi:hypothetical protein K4H28_08875 [Deefgea tanakiae]|uniref:Uncharacterized protein n=1 Tax=Deefgea tanakiae TaxID=2865840 RepID=A0ABX8Z1M5_9NEIS|nr:hypothetical protein [Deefgea tanakiae]QZA76462.1 hypothetical protein K4H28_08875 [Deefgea tanakiae]